MPQYLQIAIDGPAGAGKSTVAKGVASKLGLFYLDTGAMYRIIAYKALKKGLLLDNELEISALVETTKIEMDHSEEKKVWCDGEDVTEVIRSPEVSKAVSIIAKYPSVRSHLVNLQRKEATLGGVVMDGRDIGTYVLPDAQLKVFLTASQEERARRRWLELNKKGSNSSFEEVQRDIEVRDHRDTERKIAPLKPAPDAIIIDTTFLSIDEIINKIITLSQEVQSNESI